LLASSNANSYAQELPTRFRKEIVRAAKTGSTPASAATVGYDGFQRVLMNIGADEQQLSPRDVKLIFEELGDGREIPVSSIERII